MPEHIHLLISEPDRGTPSTVMQVLKQRFVRRVLGDLRRRRNPSQASLWQATLEAGMCGRVGSMTLWSARNVRGRRS
ncbi:MAG: hypothetical protein DMG97_17775 [Acidobacteria bacterium]|nr:MAG: hypothetical protein DMG97_17775 [Acidobacteriota bacterium]PYV75356.1 MAG: hypothetical protein DMG96_17495 [Acidobacteriota bacterium]